MLSLLNCAAKIQKDLAFGCSNNRDGREADVGWMDGEGLIIHRARPPVRTGH
jgi:hypothetical protein